MSEAVVPRPSYRVEREASLVPWRILGIAGGVLLGRGAGGGRLVGLPQLRRRQFRPAGGSRSAQVRPDDPGGLRVPNQNELTLERPGQRAQQGQGPRPGQVAPGAEAPDLGGLRAAAQPPVRPAPTPAAPPAINSVVACGSASLWAMTAHILYAAWDARRPTTLSPTIIGEVLRGEVGFDDVLVSDDLAMGAMRGQSNDLAGAAVGAGCDVLLHCTGVLAETAALLETCPALPDSAWRRLAAARDAAQRARRPVAVLA